MVKRNLEGNLMETTPEILKNNFILAENKIEADRKLILFVKKHGRLPDIISKHVQKSTLNKTKEILGFLRSNGFVKVELDNAYFSYPWFDKSRTSEKYYQELYEELFINKIDINKQTRLLLNKMLENKSWDKSNKDNVLSILGCLTNLSNKRYFLWSITKLVDGRKLLKEGLFNTYFKSVSCAGSGGFDSNHQTGFFVSLRTENKDEAAKNSELILKILKNKLVDRNNINSFGVLFKFALFSEEYKNLDALQDSLELLNDQCKKVIFNPDSFMKEVKDNLFKNKLYTDKEKKVLRLIVG